MDMMKQFRTCRRGLNCWIQYYCMTLLVTSLCLGVSKCNSDTNEIKIGVYMPSPVWNTSLSDLIERSWDRILQERIILGSEYRLTYIRITETFSPTLSGINTAVNHLRTEKISALIGPYDLIAQMITAELSVTYLVIDCPSSHVQPITLQGRTLNMAARNLLYLLPPCETVHNAAADLVKKYKWREIAVLHDNNQGLMVAERLFSRPETVTGKWLIPEQEQDILNQLLEIKRLDVDKLVVVCETKTALLLLKQALKLSMLSDRYSWIFTNLDLQSMNLDQFVYTEVNLNSFYLPSVYPGTSTSTTLPPISRRSAANTSKDSEGRVPFLETIFTDSLRLVREGVKRYLVNEQATVSCSSNLCNALNGSRLVNYMIQELRSVGGIEIDGDFKRINTTFTIMSLTSKGLKERGSWYENGSITFLKQTNQVNKTKQIHGNLLLHDVQKIVTLLDSPFVQYKSDYLNRTGNDRYEGFLIDLIEEISRRLKFRYELYESPDGNYGSKNASGHWNGMIQELIVGNAAMCLGAISITSDRLEAVDFSKPFKMKTFNLLMKKPETHSTIFQFMSPLSTNVWLAICVSLVGVSVLMHLMDTYTPGHRINAHAAVPLNLHESFWFNYGSLVGGGTEIAVNTIPARVLSSAWWFFCLIIISSYTANLAAFLTISKIDSPVQSVDDLAKQSVIKYGTVKNTYAMSMFKNSDLEVFKKMWQMMNIHNSLVNNTAEGIKRAKMGNYAFIWDSPINKHISNHECDVITTGEPFDEKGYGIGVPDRAPYRDSLSKTILNMSEAGYIKKIESKWWDAGICEGYETGSKTSDNTELNLYNVSGVFLLLALGAILAVVVCLIECGVSVLRAKYQSNHRKREVSSMISPEVDSRLPGNGYTPPIDLKASPRSLRGEAYPSYSPTPSPSVNTGSRTTVLRET